MKNIDDVLQRDALVRLVQPEYFVGWVYSIDYDSALIMTNDLWKTDAKGIPHNCFLLAASFDPREYSAVPDEEKEVILLRVVGSAKLPQDDDLLKAKVDNFQERKDAFGNGRDFDDITLNQLQFGGLNCRVLGTFFNDGGELWLGSDLESFANATRLNAYRPRGEALETIVNYVDPIRRRSAAEDAKELGIKGSIKPFPIGTVRYTSTDRLHRRADPSEMVTVTVRPSDFLARRTAVLGMTRTGKSNMLKQLVSVTKRVSDDGGVPVGQIVYDVNGEYANPNRQDEGALSEVYPKDTIRYRMIETKGFEELRTNFYDQLNEGFGIIQRELDAANRITTDYVRAFVNLSLDEPDEQDRGEHTRWEVIAAAYKTLLYSAGFSPPANQRVKFSANKEVRERIRSFSGEDLPDPSKGITLGRSKQWFLAARRANLESGLVSSSGKAWVDDNLQVLLDMIAQRRGESGFISGHRLLAGAIKYHSPKRTTDVADEIYQHLVAGKIVILDLSVGDARIREKVSDQIALKIFQNSMQKFIDGQTPPNIVVYIEEAHNLIGRRMELTETWPRLAKEGAKYRIALVYATQEVSSMHPNILANTENWFITHLNNSSEVRELAKFYDFEDFSSSLIRAQDVGFARVKSLSSPYVVPVQIDKFDPERERARRAAAESGESQVVKSGEGS